MSIPRQAKLTNNNNVSQNGALKADTISIYHVHLLWKSSVKLTFWSNLIRCICRMTAGTRFPKCCDDKNCLLMSVKRCKILALHPPDFTLIGTSRFFFLVFPPFPLSPQTHFSRICLFSHWFAHFSTIFILMTVDLSSSWIAFVGGTNSRSLFEMCHVEIPVFYLKSHF